MSEGLTYRSHAFAPTRRNPTLVGQMAHVARGPLASVHCGLRMFESMHAIDHRVKINEISVFKGNNKQTKSSRGQLLV